MFAVTLVWFAQAGHVGKSALGAGHACVHDFDAALVVTTGVCVHAERVTNAAAHDFGSANSKLIECDLARVERRDSASGSARLSEKSTKGDSNSSERCATMAGRAAENG